MTNMRKCLHYECCNVAEPGETYCTMHLMHLGGRAEPVKPSKEGMAQKYPKYYKAIPAGMTEIDVYGVCKLFPVDDATGCINHARKKLLVPGTRTGGKSFYKDIKEARDTLNRWLELNPEQADK